MLVTCTVTIPVLGGNVGSADQEAASPPLVDQYHGELARISAAQEAVLVDAAKELRGDPLHQALRRREACQREYQALYERLPAALRGRFEEGFADRDEIEDAMRRIIITDAGYDPEAAPESEEEPARSRDDEYHAYRRVRERLGEIGTVVIGYEGSRGYRRATTDNDPHAIDADGEVWDPGSNPWLMLRVAIERGGLVTAGYLSVHYADTFVGLAGAGADAASL